MSTVFIVMFLYAVYAQEELSYDFPDDYQTPEGLRHDKEDLKTRLDCVLDKQPCKPLIEVYKNIVADLVQTACSKCSPLFKTLARAFFDGVAEYYPEEYKEFIAKYDPSGLYFDDLLEVLKNY